MKKSTFFMIFLLMVLSFLPAQTAQEMEELLNNPAVSYEQAARIILKAADQLNPSNQDGFYSREEAFRLTSDKKWLPKNAAGSAEASLEGISLLIMQSFGMKGGIFYSLFKNPHYAYRELAYRDIIQGSMDPEMTVSGEMLLFLVSRVFSQTESSVTESQS